jgi:hypothetical protein
MRLLQVVLLFALIGCSSKYESKHNKIVVAISKLSLTEPTCFKYPTYISYPTVFGADQEIRGKKVSIVIKTIGTCEVRYKENDDSYACGAYVATYPNEISNSSPAFSQSGLEKLEKVACSNFGKVFKRND